MTCTLPPWAACLPDHHRSTRRSGRSLRAVGPGTRQRSVRTDRGDRRVDLWWSGKHAAHGGNVQVIAAPDGWPIWPSGVRPGREHDTTALRTHPEALPLLGEWIDAEHAALADLGYEGERAALTIPIKHRAGHRLSADQRGSSRFLVNGGSVSRRSWM